MGAGVDPHRGRRRRRRTRCPATRTSSAGRGCCRGRRRCSSGRDIGRGPAAPSRPLLEQDHGRADVVVGHRDLLAADGRGPPSLASSSSLRRGEREQRDLVDRLAELPGRGHRCRSRRTNEPLAVDRRSPAAGSSRSSPRPRGRREAAAGRRRWPPDDAARRSQTRRPAGPQMAGDARTGTDPLLRGRRTAAPTASAPAPTRTPRRGRSHARRRPPPRPATPRRAVEGLDEITVEIDPDDPVPPPRQVKRDAAGSAAEVEDRALAATRRAAPRVARSAS